MKLSDYVAEFLAKQGITHAFAVSGGASLHLIHSLERTSGISFICTQHEQAGAMAADGYARMAGGLGAAIATSGPGATNLITGICGAYYDSVPVIFVTGQVSTFRLKGDTGVRQIGFQETDVVDICRPITKYAVMIREPKLIRYELEKACYLARSGRPGPVVIDIPDNVQRVEINPRALRSFTPPKIKKTVGSDKLKKCLAFIKQAKRPVLILGWGVHLSSAERSVIELVNKLGFPVSPTWAAADILSGDHPLMIGTFGTHGTRYANFAVQNADLILSIGSRLDTKATGSPISTFARGAKKIVVDIDPKELNKFKKYGLDIELPIDADAGEFIRALIGQDIEKKDISDWRQRILAWKRKYPICPEKYYKEKEVNPYVFVKTLSSASKPDDALFLDTGCTLAWTMQAFDFKPGQRVFHDWNNTAMGWALPAAIGACFAKKDKNIICVTGDGSLQMNIQELATVIRHKLPIKIFLVNNHGYSMIRQTQDQWMGSEYLASTVNGGLAFPDFVKVAKAYGFKTLSVKNNRSLHQIIAKALKIKGPVFVNVEISGKYRVIPQVKFGRPNEDLEPLLNRNDFLSNMIVKPLKVSLVEL